LKLGDKNSVAKSHNDARRNTVRGVLRVHNAHLYLYWSAAPMVTGARWARLLPARHHAANPYDASWCSVVLPVSSIAASLRLLRTDDDEAMELTIDTICDTLFCFTRCQRQRVPDTR